MHRLLEFAGADEPPEARRSRHVGAFAHVDEQAVGPDREGFQPRQARSRRQFRQAPGAVPADGLDDGPDVRSRRSATPARQVDPAVGGELAEHFRHVFRRIVVLAEFVGQPGIGVNAHGKFRNAGQFFHVGAQFGGAQRAVEADEQRLGVADGVVERLQRLSRQRSARGIGDGAGDHHRDVRSRLLAQCLDCVQRRLGVEGVENRFHHQQVDTPPDQRGGGGGVVVGEHVEGDLPHARIVDVRGDRGRAIGGAQRTGHETGHARFFGHPVRRLARQPRGGQVDLLHPRFHPVVALGRRGGVEGVGGDDIGAGQQELPMDGGDPLRLRDAEQIVVAFQIARPVGKPLAPEIGLGQLQSLHAGTQGAIENRDPPAQQRA